ncbi:SIR2 family protein [Bacillus mojavensis]|uniref:SIR2 family NAD-dependent protein deacylase n=1 Tax=Bacillus mojavensis TaxID=72360 RepID=UPI002DBFFB82|nr:SIR2 family protein [Bacillus mojavensis]MEC1612684.1 SIR2 family protein [Bacillus mojavensis]
MSKDINVYFKENLKMYPHLENIRNNLWSNEGKSRVSVMVGAGFSKNGEKIENSFRGMAIWTDLKEQLIEKLPHYSDLEEKDVLDIGQIYVNEYGRSSLDQVLKDAIPDANYEPGRLHHELLKLPWADVYTTNYDTLLERAKMNVFDRNYQVIYDISDIPSSVQPRIIKLHGSFPANRPFIFTAKDYDEYPKKFSPFVNMVQQSIMETTFLLIGFSGDDPNFRRWTSWVQSNLGEHKPKIYMISLGQNTQKQELEELGITLIDFTDLYKGTDNPYYSMFSDLFDYLSYKHREEKSLWPHRSYKKYDFENWRYNRLTYPGWVVIPDDIRRSYRVNEIRNCFKSFLDQVSLDSIDITCIEEINEFLWCLETFYIPITEDQKEKLRSILEKILIDDLWTHEAYSLLNFMLKIARLEYDTDNFEKYVKIIESLSHEKPECLHCLVYEKIKLRLDLNDIKSVRIMLTKWNVSSKEIEWGIKKAIILLRVNDKESALQMFEDYIKVIRGLLAVKIDDYRLLSLESIALFHRVRLLPSDDSYQRLRLLQRTNTDVGKEIQRISVSIKKYELKSYQVKRGFDPHTTVSSARFEDPIKQELLDSYALVQIDESYGSFYNTTQYKLAIDNLSEFYPLYAQLKRINATSLKNIDDFLSREAVYKLTDKNLEMLLEVVENTISYNEYSFVKPNKYLEIISRIYYALSSKQTNLADRIILRFINKIKQFDIETSKVLHKLIRRMFLAKDLSSANEFCENLLKLPLRSQFEGDHPYYRHAFFEPFLSLMNNTDRKLNINISDNQLEVLFDYFINQDISLKESALIRITFLELTNCLPQQYSDKFKKILSEWRKKTNGSISDFLYDSIFDNIILSEEIPPSDYLSKFVNKEIPKFYHEDGAFSDGGTLRNYLQELNNVFLNFVKLSEKDVNNESYYKMWLKKFYIWWDSQKNGLLQNLLDILNPKQDLLKSVVIVLKNNILSTIPLQVVDQEDREKIKGIYNEINKRNKTLSYMLLPCLERLNIDIDISLNEVIFYLQGKDPKKVNVLANLLYDYLILINKSQLFKDPIPIKTELFNLLRYGSAQSYESISSIGFIIKNAPDVFNDTDYNYIISLANRFLDELKNNDFEITSYDDFEILAAFGFSVGYLIKHKNSQFKDDLNEWKNFIINHKLPEVRIYSDLFDC